MCAHTHQDIDIIHVPHRVDDGYEYTDVRENKSRTRTDGLMGYFEVYT